MKRFLFTIILSLTFFSNLIYMSTYAEDGRLGELLEVRTGPEVFLLESIPQLSENRFSHSWVSQTFREFQAIDNALRNEFISKYRQGEYSYYQMRDLVESYRNFVYHTNKAFEYIEIRSQWNNSEEIQKALYSHYIKLRKYFIQVQRLSR